ncbi:glycerophosphodiester phosphodiesterase family protein [Microterricola viridarii]|uniref:Glycerophosphodiester phosphodiesterase n=1 Tax=Microterricola viridarii TaxID=412690 RepID=A0A120I1G9_9MICO|nr:glycerophosphodiester phosphodiesterase family protein [Microterricola viridarii]AMB60377.1 glycerophosphodiester phosphodiesterase [Microterricola viridarii]
MNPDTSSHYLDSTGPRVLAHRGLATEAPENTLLAFRNALAAGVTYLETDVHASSDGVAVICHDADLSRLASRAVAVGELSFAELAAIDLGAGQHFVSLAEALAAFPTARFNIDVKDSASVAPTAAAVSAAQATERVLITSFSEKRRRETVRLLPGVASSASSTRFAIALLAAKLGLFPVVRRALAGFVAVQVPQTAGPLTITTPRVISAMHRAGVEVHVWTVNEEAEMTALLALGVDGLVTDRADIAMRVLAAQA